MWFIFVRFILGLYVNWVLSRPILACAKIHRHESCRHLFVYSQTQVECSIDKLAENGWHGETDSESSQRAAQSWQKWPQSPGSSQKTTLQLHEGLVHTSLSDPGY